MSQRDIGKSAALGLGYGGASTGRWAAMSLNNDMKRWANMALNETNETRFRSFCERYVIERASSFRPNHEEEDQWTAMLNAKSAYRKIEAMGRGIAAEDEALRSKAQAEEEQLRGRGQSAGQMAAPVTSRFVPGRLPSEFGTPGFMTGKPYRHGKIAK